ncbi:hypothetical protein Slin15195_G103250 [Septoria linicola]|uniref:Secreted protein n=1 Tax=Septoria linicola TaxID=215465 RepID=A0A9Q9B4F4_9PEZI|nr:hypothetical protein Slin14017_G066250 [Septoria linicola]USW57006.1 hypothetical protein Slin15195_G103250 [Septoria linicola]
MVVAGLLLAALYASIIAAESVITEAPFDKFRIGIARYENPQCRGNATGPTKSMERYDNHNISSRRCHSWEDDRPFMSFSY